jgi:hypothetical protein
VCETHLSADVPHRYRNSLAPSALASGAADHTAAGTAREIKKLVRKGSAAYIRCRPATSRDFSSGNCAQKSNGRELCCGREGVKIDRRRER